MGKYIDKLAEKLADANDDGNISLEEAKHVFRITYKEENLQEYFLSPLAIDNSLSSAIFNIFVCPFLASHGSELDKFVNEK